MVRWSNSKNISPNKLNAFFKVIGWSNRSKIKWSKVLRKSNYVVSAWDKTNLIGLGRIVEDGVMCMFYDIGVHPNYRGKGIGNEIMCKLIAKVKNKSYASIGLFAWEKNPDNIKFYEKHGFKKVPTGMELTKYMERE
jgi:ribosomal protein S18 acetylase RimI-like enzyme